MCRGILIWGLRIERTSLESLQSKVTIGNVLSKTVGVPTG